LIMKVSKSTFKISDKAVDDSFKTYLRQNVQSRLPLYIVLLTLMLAV
jgi:hypothetical protein